jgi:hypothetical protein
MDDRFRDGLRRFWAELNTPDDFAGQPVDGLKNQGSHVQIGLVIHGLVFAASVLIWRDVPPLWLTALILTAGYLVIIELRVQTWNGNDTIADAYFFGVGAAFWPIILSVTPSETLARIDQMAWGILIWTGVLLVSLAAYAAPRIWPPED